VSKFPPIAIPALRGRVLAFAIPALLLALLALGYAGMARSRAAFEQDDARARRLLAGLSAAAATIGPDQPERLQTMVAEVAAAGSPIRWAWLITEKQVGAYVFQKARTYVVHSDSLLAGTRLESEQGRDKAAYDISKEVELRYEKYAASRPDLTLYLARSADGHSIEVAGPVVQEGKLVGTMGLNVTDQHPDIPLPVSFVLLVLLSAIALAALIFRFVSCRVLSGVLAGALLLATAFLLQQGITQRVVWEGERYAASRTLADTVALDLAAPDPSFRQPLAVALGQVAGPGQPVTAISGALAPEGSPRDLLATAPALLPPPGSLLHGVKVSQGPAVLQGTAIGVQLGTRLVTTGLALLLLFVLGYLGYLQRFGRMVRDHAYAYGYAAPAMIGMVVFVFFPFASGFLFSFFERVTGDDLAGTVVMFGIPFRFMGLRNFFDILGSREYALTDALNFYFTLGVTILWTVSNVGLHVAIGLALALLLKNPWLKLKGVYRVLLIVPWAMPNYITALIWRGMFDVEYGTVNHVLVALGLGKVAWWSHFWSAFAANLTTNVWLGFPFMMVICLGALQSIPGDLYEAAEVDGASRWQQFRNITLPLLKPALFPAVILGAIWTFNMFNVIYLVSGGAPEHRTDILITQAYRFAFEAGRYGYAAAYAVIIFFILLVYGLGTNRMTKASEGAFD